MESVHQNRKGEIILDFNVIYNEDCLLGMARIPDQSVDLILTDLPYGITAHKWDAAIPLERLWEHYHRIAKHHAAIVLFGVEPLSCDLIQSNRKNFRYKWIWDKGWATNFQHARRMPMKCHEEICVFYRKSPTYNPQWWYSTPYKAVHRKRKKPIEWMDGGVARDYSITAGSEDGRRYPLSILDFPRDGEWYHSAQKPVALLEYLIKTYTNEGDVVLDSCFGSGSTIIAAANTNRRYIGFETDPKYFEIARNRLAAITQKSA